MKDYVVSYYLGNMFHRYTVEAENEYEAMLKVLNGIQETSKRLFCDFKIKRANDN